ncbi:MAG: hypothetical protein WA117_20990, partial [Verrucomicrobiia bacterium]
HDDFGVIGLTARTPDAFKRTTGDPPEFQAFSPHVPMDEETGEAVGLYYNCGGFVNRPLFGDAANLSATARLSSSLVAADPNDVAQVSAALSDIELNPAAQTGKQQMKELIAKLCAKWKLDPEKAKEAELIAAFEQEQQSVAALTARAGLVEPVIVALGFDKTSTPKPEELTGKITALGKQDTNVIMLADYAKELTGLAVGIGLISPAEKETWERRIKFDRANEVKELMAKKPTVPTQRIVIEGGAGAGAGGNGEPKWKTRVNEMVAKDAELSKIAVGNPDRAVTLAMERLIKIEPAIFAEQ